MKTIWNTGKELKKDLVKSYNLKPRLIQKEFYSESEFSRCVRIADRNLIARYPELSLMSKTYEESNILISLVDPYMRKITDFLFDFLEF